MRKLIKKSLAICLVAALSLTLFAGALSANAEDALTGTIVAGTANVEVGATEVTVPVTIEADAINTAKIAVSSDFGAVTAIATETAACKTIEDINGGTFLIEAKDNVAGFTSAVINVTFTAEAAPAAGEYAVAIELVEVHAANWDEAVVTLTPTAGKIVVAEPVVEEAALEYTTVAYDLAANKLSVNYAAPSQAVKDVLSQYKSAGNRVVKLVLNVGGAEFLFDASIASGGGTLNVSGFALPHMNTDVSVTIRVTADGLDAYEFNAYEIVIADYLATQAGNAQVDAWLALNDAWKAGNESIDILADTTVAEGVVDYTTITYDTESSKISFGYGAPNADLKAILSTAKTNGNRKVELVLKLDGVEFPTKFDVTFSSGGGSMNISGFGLTHFTQEVEMFVRVTSGANGEYVENLNSIKVDLDSIMKSAEGSAFATAYAAYAN